MDEIKKHYFAITFGGVVLVFPQNNLEIELYFYYTEKK